MWSRPVYSDKIADDAPGSYTLSSITVDQKVVLLLPLAEQLLTLTRLLKATAKRRLSIQVLMAISKLRLKDQNEYVLALLVRLALLERTTEPVVKF